MAHAQYPQKSDAELITLAQQGDKVAFTDLWERYSGRVYGLVWTVLGNCADAEDAAQEVFLRVLKALPRFRNENFAGWILQIARNFALRKKKNSRTQPLIAGKDDPEDLLSPDAQIIDAEVQAQLKECMGKLAADAREVIIGRFLDGLSSVVLGKRLDRTDSAVNSLRARSLDQLRICMEQGQS